MTNRKLIEDAMNRKGLKKGFVADKLGVSRATFWALLSGKTEFKASQIKALCELLDIDDSETIAAIFFAPNGALKATTKDVRT